MKQEENYVVILTAKLGPGRIVEVLGPADTTRAELDMVSELLKRLYEQSQLSTGGCKRMTRRRRRTRDTDPENPRQKALALIELALDAGTSTEEGRTAAVRAVKFIDKYDLLSVPFQGNETVRAAMDIAETLTSSDLIGNAKTLLDQLKQRQRR